MSKKIKEVHLSFACEQAWDVMQESEKGRFCSQCTKHVHDFTDKTADDLQLAIAENKGKLCGRFKRSQLSDTFLKYAASAFIATVAVGSTACDSPAEERKDGETTESVTTSESHTTLGMVVPPVADPGTYHMPAVPTEDLPDLENIPITGELAYPLPDSELKISPAEPKGGYEQFYARLYKDVKVPTGLTTGGKVYARMTIDTNGNISQVEIMQGFHEELEKEVIRVLLEMEGAFEPERTEGKPVESVRTLPFTFKINNIEQ